MNKLQVILLFIVGMSSCDNEIEKAKMQYLTEEIPGYIPIDFKPDIIPDGKIIHKGIFSPDLQSYYYTLSDKHYEHFDVFRIEKNKGVWSEPERAFFDSKYDEHGMSFSPDGNTLYFSSTRPVKINGIPQTWHIWKSDKIDGNWNEPVFVDIPNLRDRLVSHSTITNSGTLYFHASNLDYSEMDIYYSNKINDTFSEAKRISITMDESVGKCTPYVSPEEAYLIFASIGNQLDLMISFNDGNGQWSNTRKLNDQINDAGQGNPFVTPDKKFLFFTTGKHQDTNWRVKWVNIASEIVRNE